MNEDAKQTLNDVQATMASLDTQATPPPAGWVKAHMVWVIALACFLGGAVVGYVTPHHAASLGMGPSVKPSTP